MPASPAWSVPRVDEDDDDGEEWEELLDDPASSHSPGNDGARRRRAARNDDRHRRRYRGDRNGGVSSRGRSGGGSNNQRQHASETSDGRRRLTVSLRHSFPFTQRRGSGGSGGGGPSSRLRGTAKPLRYLSLRRGRRRRSSGGESNLTSGGAPNGEGIIGASSFFGRWGGHHTKRPSRLISTAMEIARLGGTGPLSSHLLDWRVPSLTAEQELVQQVFAAAYTDACYRCLTTQDTAKAFGPNETLQLAIDQWRAEAFEESQDILRQVVEQYHHDLLQAVTAIVDAEDAALVAISNEAAASEENISATGVSLNDASMSGHPYGTSSSSDSTLYQAFMAVGQSAIPISIECPAVTSKTLLHYAMPALGRVMVYQGFFLCFWYSSTGEHFGQLEYRACRWVLEAHVPHVHVPLCYHFRYKGRGVTAMSLTPIGENLTAVTEQNPEVAALAQQLASVLSLLPYGSPPGRADKVAAAAAAAASAAAHDRYGASLNASFASSSSAAAAASVDGEVAPETYFLPRSVRVHFAQDGRYYFLRNHQWFMPWLNSRQSCDAAVQRLSYVSPRLLAVCGVQVSCRACQRDAFLEENRVALEFMRHEVDVGIPRLLQTEQDFFVQAALRRRQRAAARRLREQRRARAAEEAAAEDHTTRIWVGDDGEEAQQGHGAAADNPLSAASSPHAKDRAQHGSHRFASSPKSGDGFSDRFDHVHGSSDGTSSADSSSDSDWEVLDNGDGSSAAAAAALPETLLPFTTTSVVARFSARGYPKSLLGVLLLALVQYPAAPMHMVREVTREILFRGLKAFILTRAYEARFGVEQLLARLPHERVNDEDASSDFLDVSECSSDSDFEPTAEEVSGNRDTNARSGDGDSGNAGGGDNSDSGVRNDGQVINNSSLGSSSGPRGSVNEDSQSASASRRYSSDGENSRRRTGHSHANAENSLSISREARARDAAAGPRATPSPAMGNAAAVTPTAAMMNPLQRFPTANSSSPAGMSAAAAAARSPTSFAARWQESGEAAALTSPRATTAEPRPTAMQAKEEHQHRWYGRLLHRASALRPRWFGGNYEAGAAAAATGAMAGGNGDGVEAAGGATPPLSGSGGSSQSTSQQPQQPPAASLAAGQAGLPQLGTAFRNPLRPSGVGVATAAAAGASTTLESTRGAGTSFGSLPSSSSALPPQVMLAAADPAFTATWADFSTTAERVLAAFMQYDGTTRPSHVFCDSTRRLHTLHALQAKIRAIVASGSGTALSSNFNKIGSLAKTHQATVAQQHEAEAALWSSADVLNRLYAEQILPFVYRKFRLSPRRVGVLYEPLNEEDRAIVYVRLLEALGLSIKDGEVHQVVPIVKDFSPLRAETLGPAPVPWDNVRGEDNGAATATTTTETDGGRTPSRSPHSRAATPANGDTGNGRGSSSSTSYGREQHQQQQHSNPLQHHSQHPRHAHRNASEGSTGGQRPENPLLRRAPLATPPPPRISTAQLLSSAERDGGKGTSTSRSVLDLASPLSIQTSQDEEEAEVGDGEGTMEMDTDEWGNDSPQQAHAGGGGGARSGGRSTGHHTRHSRHHRHHPADSATTPGEDADDGEHADRRRGHSNRHDRHVPAPLPLVRGLHYVLPSWIVSRARVLIQRFLSETATAGDRNGSSRHHHRHHRADHRSGSPGRLTNAEADANAASLQVAGLVPLLSLFYNAPSSAFVTDPHRPPLPPWPRVAARLLTSLRAVSVTPHLVWDALELYELVDLRTLLQELRMESSSTSHRPSMSPTVAAPAELLPVQRRADRSTPTPAGGHVRRSSGATGNDSNSGDAMHLPTARCALVLALFYRRQTLRTTSDRTILIQVLQRYAAAIRSCPSLLSMLAPLYNTNGTGIAFNSSCSGVSGGERMTSSGNNNNTVAAAAAQAGTANALMNSLAELTWSGEAGTGKVDLEPVYLAIVPLLEEVLLNADHLLEHLGNPFGAQYRHYTAELIACLESAMATVAASVGGGNHGMQHNAAGSLFCSSTHSTGSSSVTPHSRDSHGQVSGSEMDTSGEATTTLLTREETTLTANMGGGGGAALQWLLEERELTLQHMWKHLVTYCKPDSMAARDALQRGVVLFRQCEATAFATQQQQQHQQQQQQPFAGRTAGGSSGFFDGGVSGAASGSLASAAGGNSAATAGARPTPDLPRDAAVEEALQRACELFLTTEGISSPLTMRAYCDMALYWFIVGCYDEWQEWIHRLRRLWREGGPEDIRQLLMSTVATNHFGSVGGGGSSLRSGAWSHAGEVHPSVVANSTSSNGGGSGTRSGSGPRIATPNQPVDKVSNGEGRNMAGAPIAFLHQMPEA